MKLASGEVLASMKSLVTETPGLSTEQSGLPGCHRREGGMKSVPNGQCVAGNQLNHRESHCKARSCLLHDEEVLPC